MRHHFLSFIRKNLFLTIILTIIGCLLFYTILRVYFHPFFPFILLFALSINLILFYTVTRKAVSDKRLVGMVVSSFLIKFFSYLAIVIIFLIFVKSRPIRLTFVSVLFILYISFTWLEVHSLLKFLKSGEKK